MKRPTHCHAGQQQHTGLARRAKAAETGGAIGPIPLLRH